MNYYLKCYDLYLADVMIENNQIVNLALDKDLRKMYNDFELAEEDRKIIYIETGLNLVVKKFKED